MRVGEDLDLDVPRPLDQPLDVERAVAERRGRLAPRRRRSRRRSVLVARRRACPCRRRRRRLDQDREADRARRGEQRPRRTGRPASSPGTTGTPAACISARAPIFDPMRSIDVRRRADEDQAGLLARRARTRRARTGTRSRDAPRRRRSSRAAVDQRAECSGSSRPARRRPDAARRGRRRGRAARRRRRPSTPRRVSMPSSRQARDDADGDLAAVGDEHAADRHRLDPARLALLEERAHAFLAFGRDALRGDASRS